MSAVNDDRLVFSKLSVVALRSGHRGLRAAQVRIRDDVYRVALLQIAS
jgi:hypothetical protein